MSRPSYLPRAPHPWPGFIDAYAEWLRAGGQSARTIELRCFQLHRLGRDLGRHPAEVTEADLTAWFAGCAELKPETRRSHQAAVRKFFAWAVRTGRIGANPAAELPRLPMGTAIPRPADDATWRQALAVADARLTLILRLAAEAGLRRAEVARVRTDDLLDSPLGPQLLVHGKGGRKRLVPLSPALAEQVRAGAAGHTPGAARAGWLFPNVGNDGPLSARYVGTLVSRILPPGVGMHTLRHRFATRAYRGSRNLRAVQTLLGHASVATTQRYTAVDDDELRAAAMAAAL